MALSISTLNHFSSTHLKCLPSFSNFTILASSAFLPRRLSVRAIPKRCRFRRVSSAATSGDDNSQRSGEPSSLSHEIVALNVEGMMCEGCADSVKKLLESRSSAGEYLRLLAAGYLIKRSVTFFANSAF